MTHLRSMIVVRANINMAAIMIFTGVALGDDQHLRDDSLPSPIRPLRVDKIPGPKNPQNGEPFHVEDPPDEGEVVCDADNERPVKRRCGLW